MLFNPQHRVHTFQLNKKKTIYVKFENKIHCSSIKQFPCLAMAKKYLKMLNVIYCQQPTCTMRISLDAIVYDISSWCSMIHDKYSAYVYAVKTMHVYMNIHT